MKYTSELGVINYEFYTELDNAPVDLDLVFTVGKADKVLCIGEIETVDGKMQSVIKLLSEFCTAFNDGCLVYSVDAKTTGMNAMMRYVIQQVGFISTARFIDDRDCTLFVYRNVTASRVIQNLEDEYFSFVLDEMLRDDNDERLKLLYDRIGNASVRKLQEKVNIFCDGVNTTPARMEL